MPTLSRMRRIVLPAALARIAVGIRVSAGVALVVAVTVEIVLNPQGLGYGMIIAAQSLRPELMWAELLWVGLAGWAFNTLLLIIDRRWLRRYQPGGAQTP
jgi:NitT/TauT family transport system permease protein